VALHCSGASYSMALSFIKVATHDTPAGPKCLRISSGILLSPELLFALKLCLSVSVSSAYVMWWVAGSVSGMKQSGGIISS
jgi:hypothetical protein